MLYLVTGGNGAGKTLNTLKWCKELADKDARPVCYNGRFDLNPDGPLKNWKKIDAKDWQNEPDGTIFFFDECHNDFPVRPNGSPVPDYVRMLAEHRKRGFDFFLITQHPQNIDVFVRRLIASPGYHRHLKRVFGADLVSVLEWSAVNPQCERPGSGDSGSVKTVPFPKEVYGWYKSAMLHTGKRKIPKAVWLLAACVLAVPVLGYVAWSKMPTGKSQEAKEDSPVLGPSRAPLVQRSAPTGPVSAQAYVTRYVPRIEGMPHTAPAYDDLVKPVQAPYPAACIERKAKDDCTCYTQQGTKLQTPKDLCRQIVENGFFMDWAGPQSAPGAHSSHRQATGESGAAAGVADAAPVLPVVAHPNAG